MKIISGEIVAKFKKYLTEEEKAKATIEKYVRDVISFMKWLSGRTVEKSVVLEYKQELLEEYSPASVNSILSSLNNFFVFNEWLEMSINVHFY